MTELELQRKFWKLKNMEHAEKRPETNVQEELMPIFINQDQRQGFLYSRVSTSQQVEYGHSLEAQYSQMLNYCDSNNIQIIGNFKDAGISGGEMKNRPELLLMLESLRPKYVVVCSAISRLSRNTEQLLQITKIIQQK